MVVGIFISAFFLFPSFSLAKETYFNFMPSSDFLDTGKDYNVMFIYSLSGATVSNFTVIPSSSSAIVEIFDDVNNTWILNNSPRTNYPHLSETMKIKIVQVNDPFLDLCFQVQYLVNGKIFQSSCRRVWNRKYYLSYLEQINRRLKIP